MSIIAPPPDSWSDEPWADDPRYGADGVPVGWSPRGEALDRLIGVSTLISVHVADRAVAIDRMRVLAIREARDQGRIDVGMVERSVRLEIAAALGVTESTAGAWMLRAEALVHRYPSVLDALGGARITEQHANTLVDALDEIPERERESLVERAVALAEQHPVGVFRRRLRALIDDARAVTLEERYQLAVGRRRVAVEPGADAMSWLNVHLPTVDAHAIFDRATRMAKRIAAHPDEHRTLDQIRTDVISDLLIHGDTVTVPAKARGIRARVVVTVPALTLLADGPIPPGASPVVEGIGPIPLSRARELCGGGAEWMRILTHPETGIVLSAGRDTYRPPAPLRRLVQWRADRCMAPGCGMPASRCETDHNIDWSRGGSTDLDNLAPFCTGHHIVRHHGDWQIRHLDGGAIEWTSPTGRIYLVEPERRVPTFTPANDPPPF